MSLSPDYVVAIGASAGGLIPLQELIESLPADIGNVAIVIAQHLSPEYKSMLPEIISRKTAFPTTTIINDEKLELNHIYVTPPNCDAIFKDNSLQIVETTIGGPRPNIDRLFTSLAKTYGSKAIGIILSGTGHDGSNGIKKIKEAGGLTICQDPSNAKYTGMPQAAMNTGMVDVILPAAEIGAKLVELIHEEKPVILKKAEKKSPEGSESDNDITQLLYLLEEKVGTNFNNYKSSTIIRRIEKRLKELSLSSIKQYLSYINEHDAELDLFYNYLLIGVTSFFRDIEAFDELKNILKDYIAKLPSKSSFRVWVPGCATGEESVSLAIIINELFGELTRYDIKLQIFATDIDNNALKFARRGAYEKHKVEALPKEIIKKYFIEEKDKYETTLELKNSILYTRHDLTSNPPFLRLDLISCRNLFIYFNQSLQNQLFPIFQYSLNNNGILFLGKSESIGNFKASFNTISPKYRIFSRKETESGKTMRIPSRKSVTGEKVSSSTHGITKISFSIQDMVKETIFTTFDKPYIIIDEHADIIEISGDVNKYISIKSGNANINLLRLIKEELHLELRSLLSNAVNNKKNVSGRLRRLKQDASQQLMRIQIKPLYLSKPKMPFFMVIFDSIDIEEPFLNVTEAQGSLLSDTKRIEELEYELEGNRQHMNTLIEELETTNEELQALNEELQSSNEEMQASNEELETSNEELHATNEELENAYVDLRTLTSRLARQKQMLEQVAMASPDLIAVLRGDDFVFEYINPSLQQLFPRKNFNGTTLENLLPKMLSDESFDTLQEIKKTKSTYRKKEVPLVFDYNNDGYNETRYFNITCAPLVAEDSNDTDIIVYAVDITDAIIVRNKAQENADFFSTLAESMPQKVWIAENSGYITYINKTFRNYFNIGLFEKNQMTINMFLDEPDAVMFDEMWHKNLKDKTPFKMQVQFKVDDHTQHWHLCDCRPLNGPDGKINSWICTATDIHEEKTIEKKKDEFMSIASHELKTPLTTIMGYLQLLDEVLMQDDCETAKVYVKRANKGLNRISVLVGDLLDVTRMETGKLTFYKEKVSFDKLVSEAIEDFKPLASSHELVVELQQTNQYVHVDSLRIQQVIFNLLSNAVKYSPEADKIIVKTYHAGNALFFEVEDFGPGVSGAFAEKIFEKFFRANEGQDFNSGLGIGLYISKEIITRHGGDIFLQSKEKEGSKFIFQLPVAK
ncbi:PAS domain-containing protein [Panacibacter sp. DH6]|uniref:PAS domain-containing protein n=1 Tax=Panacibacter microcysteis TaxID=2793269 RepID=A0A931E906_9BACT|nr:chemotaxis protein CheB [Panacibacter microcysteis]MBG9377363.1 PAS domain-containing protein [Panacibacter microcysteis]